ncbi:MAG: LPS export ABC transporter permease LptF [Succinivibrio sp.]
MILNRYIFREILKAQVVTLVVLFLVFLCQSYVRYISRAASGEIQMEIINRMVLYSIPSIAYLMLPLSLFVAILIAVGRISSDSEMVVMRSVGYSGGSIMAIAMVLAAATSVLCAANGLWFMPESAAAQQELTREAQSNPQYLPIDSGRFVNFASGGNEHVIFIENVTGGSGDKRKLGNIYVMTNTFFGGRNAFTTAKHGRVTFDEDGFQWLNLSEGNRYEGPMPPYGRYRTASFSTMQIPAGQRESASADPGDIQEMPTASLVGSPDPRLSLELQWRIAPAIAVFVLTMVAVPLALVNPRQGRFSRLWQAILLYVAYYMLLLSFRNMINAGRLWVLPGLYLVPVIFAIACAVPINLRAEISRRLAMRAARRRPR